MSEKLIYADKLIMTLESMRGSKTHATIDNIIYNLKIAPAVEVVRCSQCVNNPRIGTKTKGMVWCRKFRSEMRPDDFCSYGERREDVK